MRVSLIRSFDVISSQVPFQTRGVTARVFQPGSHDRSYRIGGTIKQYCLHPRAIVDIDGATTRSQARPNTPSHAKSIDERCEYAPIRRQSRIISGYLISFESSSRYQHIHPTRLHHILFYNLLTITYLCNPPHGAAQQSTPITLLAISCVRSLSENFVQHRIPRVTKSGGPITIVAAVSLYFSGEPSFVLDSSQTVLTFTYSWLPDSMGAVSGTVPGISSLGIRHPGNIARLLVDFQGGAALEVCM
ncbi:hypothetical protein Hypma_006044 [Hypsizygus marmoreus]|uniref:Uncharacterized protein n=1 Tax=Hypsizygus marmoreus TaxID=39966 RepID=A0A369K1F5_HYPMA|nr:hypothetical protein Hypma_006044 [Hypsizygus marmoreus]